MKSLSRAVVIAACAGLLAGCDGRYQVTGRVLDEVGAPVTDADVTLRATPFGKIAKPFRFEQTVRTNAAGDYTAWFDPEQGEWGVDIEAAHAAPDHDGLTWRTFTLVTPEDVGDSVDFGDLRLPSLSLEIRPNEEEPELFVAGPALGLGGGLHLGWDTTLEGRTARRIEPLETSSGGGARVPSGVLEDFPTSALETDGYNFTSTVISFIAYREKPLPHPPRIPASRGARCWLDGVERTPCPLTDGALEPLDLGFLGVGEIRLQLPHAVRLSKAVLRGIKFNLQTTPPTEVRLEIEGLSADGVTWRSLVPSTVYPGPSYTVPIRLEPNLGETSELRIRSIWTGGTMVRVDELSFD